MDQKTEADKDVKIPVHIDPREIVKEFPVDDIIKMAEMMKDSGSTPYRYIRRAFKCLAEGDYGTACGWIEYTDRFLYLFYPPKSEENDALKTTIDILRPMFLFLGEKFKELRPEVKECGDKEGAV